jgi:PAS domain-containing protein
MSPRAKSAAAWLCLTLATAGMAALGLDRALCLIARDLIDTADEVSAGIYQQIRVPSLEAGADPLKSLQDDIELQRFLRISRALRRSLVYTQIENADGRVILSADQAAPDWISKKESSIEDLRRQLRSRIPLALLPALWSPRTFVYRRPVLFDGHELETINVGISTALMAEDVRAQTGVLAGGAILTLGLTWLVFCLIASRLTGARDILGAGAAAEPIVRKRHRWKIPGLGGPPKPLGASDGSNAAAAQDSLLELLDSIHDGALTIDGRGVVGFANSKARYLLGPQAAIPGKSIRNALGNEHPLIQILEAAIAGPVKSQHVQLNVYGSQNRFETVTVSTFPVNREQGLVVLLGEPIPIDQMQDYCGDLFLAETTAQPNGSARHSALVEITVSEQGKAGIHPRHLRELLDLYFAEHNDACGRALLSRAQELQRAISRQQVDDDQVIARLRLAVASAQSIVG